MTKNDLNIALKEKSDPLWHTPFDVKSTRLMA